MHNHQRQEAWLNNKMNELKDEKNNQYTINSAIHNFFLTLQKILFLPLKIITYYNSAYFLLLIFSFCAL